MKKLICVGIAIFALMAVTATAGDYHRGATLVCNDCHVMHFSQSHQYGDGTPEIIPVNGPNASLLRAPVNEVCLTCHDGQTTAPDVLGANFNNYVRNAGGLNEDDGSTTGYATTSGHSLEYMGNIPGSNPAKQDTLECSSCHAVHGGANYRNLGPRGTAVTLTYAIGTNDLSKDIWEKSATHMYDGGANHYATSNIEYNHPGNAGSQYAQWCKQCHTNMHGAADGAEYKGTGGATGAFVRHPASDAFIGNGGSTYYRAASSTRPGGGIARLLYRPKLMSASGSWGDQGTYLPGGPTGGTAVTDLAPGCMTCHKSHGNQNPFGLIYASGSVPIDENGDGTYSQLCWQCHTMGSVLPGQI